MKKRILSLSLLSFSGLGMAQIGINNPNPRATLDITAKTLTGNPTDKPEGIIAPRLTGDQIKAKDSLYGSAQTGTIVYALDRVGTVSTKTANITSAGYYYFDGNIWQKITGQSIEPWNTSGTTTPATSNTQNIYQTGNVGVGINAPTTKLHVVTTAANTGFRLVDTTQGAGKVLTSDANGSASWQTLAAIPTEPWNVSGTTTPATSNTQNIYQTGNVGVGINTPATKLHVVANAANTGFTLVDTTQGVGKVLTSNASGNASWQTPAAIPTEPWNIATTTNPATSNTQNIYQTGNVGIGVGLTTPATKLHIVASAANVGFRLVDTTQGAGKVLTSDANGSASWQTPAAIPVIPTEPWNVSGTTTPATSNTQNIYQTGNVGVGVNTPTTKLHIVTPTANTGFRLVDTTQGAGKILTSDANGNARWQTPAAIPVIPTEPWNVSGTTTPATSNTQNIYQTGNVGVGVNTPTTKLHIVTPTANTGFRLVDTTQGAGKVLTSDVNGNARWTSPVIETILGVKENGWDGRDILMTDGLSVQNQSNISRRDVFKHCGSYIDLPPGKWAVNVTMLMKPTGAPYQVTPNNSSYWLRSTFTTSPADEITVNSVPPYIQGSHLISGNLPSNTVYSLVTGMIIINNTGTTTVRYYYMAGSNVVNNVNYNISLFGGYHWAEDNIIAYRIN